MGWLFGWRRTTPIDDAAWRHAIAASPLARRMDAADLARLRDHVGRFLARQRLRAFGGLELGAGDWLLLAVQACIPLVRPGTQALRGWREVLVYPGEFRVRRHHHDERDGVVSEVDEVLAGEAWERGPLVLSWADVQADLASPWDGFNVIVHEMAHKLDMVDGPADGVPVLPAGIPRRTWIETFQRAYDRLSADVDRGRRTHIDPYAAESAGEYFAVVAELHYSSPATLERAEPAVAALLHRYFGASPAQRP